VAAGAFGFLIFSHAMAGRQRKEAIPRREAGEVLADIARTCNANHSIISRV
jgi:hypothetical protein